MSENVTTILRWIAVPFAAILGAMIAAFMSYILLTIINPNPDLIDVIIPIVIIGFVRGTAFVFFGTVTAPKKKDVVIIVLATLVAAYSIIAGIACAISHEWGDLITHICAIAGAIYMGTLSGDYKDKHVSPQQ